MLTDWIVTTLLATLVIYLAVMTIYYRSLLERERKSNKLVSSTVDDSEIIIRKYQIQLQRALGNIDMLSDELTKVKNDIKSLRTRNSQYRIENEKQTARVKELEGKIEALL